MGDAGGLYVLLDVLGQRPQGRPARASHSTAATFGVDFNPAANALRVVSNTGQNLRQPFGSEDAPVGATVVDVR